jgi:hypothetical protein
MHQFTTITRTGGGQLPEGLSLLAAPIIGDECSPETEPLGAVEGVIVDESRHVVFFVVRAAQHLHWTAKRVLMPPAALSIEEGEGTPRGKLILRTSWTRDQLMAQPDFLDDSRLPTSRVDGAPPPAGRWAPAVPNVIPPGSGVNRAKAMRLGTTWGALGALFGVTLGAVLGYVAGSLFAMITTAIFFGLAAGIAGAIAGATRDSAVDAGELHAMNPESGGPSATVMTNAGTAGKRYLRALESALSPRALYESGALKATRIIATMNHVGRQTEERNAPPIIEASKPLRT